MSTYRTVWGLKIYLDAEYTQDTDIGLYTAGGVSWFRWIESAIVGTVDTYKTGIILPGGIGAIDEGGSFERGGGFVDVAAITVQLCNTAQLYKSLDDAGIGINGLRAEVIEFVQTVVGGAVSEVIRGHFKTNIDSWSIANYQLPLEPAVYNRNAPMGTQVDIESHPNAGDDDLGVTIPCTFGSFYDGKYAKMVRTASKETTFSNRTLGGYVKSGSGSIYVTPTVSYFPIVHVPTRQIAYSSLTGTFIEGEYVSFGGGGSGTISYDNGSNSMKIFDHDGTHSGTITGATSGATATAGSVTAIDAADPNLDYIIETGLVDPGAHSGTQSPSNIYIKVVKDANSLEGQYKAVEKISNYSGLYYVIRLKQYLSVNLTAESNGDGSWIQVVQIDREYQSDVWELKSFVDGNGDALSNSPELYAYNSKKQISVDTSLSEEQNVDVREYPYSYIRIPQYGYDIIGLSLNNKIQIEAWLFDNDVDTMFSYFGIPIDSTTLKLLSDNPSVYQSDISVPIKLRNGLFTLTGYYNFPSATLALTGESNVSDKDDTSQADLTLTDNEYNSRRSVARYIIAVEFKFPAPPEGLNYDNAYLALDIRSSVQPRAFNLQPGAHVDFLACKRRWMGTGEAILNYATYGAKYFDINNEDGVSGRVDDMLDQYFSANRADTKNIYFYVLPVLESTIIGNMYKTIRALELFKITEYELQYKCGLLFYRHLDNGGDNSPVGAFVDGIDIKNLSVMFEKKVSIKEEVYTTCKGRIFNDTWGGRKTAADTIEDPIDQYEHACRLQNWADAAVSPGKGYSASALINTAATIGGFGSPRLETVRSLRPSFQIPDYAKSWTKPFKEQMLRTTWCVGYIDEDGKECIAFLPKKSSDSITDTVTYADVPHGMEPGPVQEPRPENVFCEPFVRYNWNEAAKKYDGLIAIKETHRGTGNWLAGYTPGFDGGEGEFFWERCATEFWPRYHQIESPPSELTDQPFISRYEDAKWHLTTWLDWMLVRRITIPIYYDKGKTWHVGRHIYLNLPHQTNGAAQEAVIERIVKNKSGGFCELSLAYWVEDPATYYYKDTMDTAAEGADADWKDTMDLANPNYKNQM